MKKNFQFRTVTYNINTFQNGYIHWLLIGLFISLLGNAQAYSQNPYKLRSSMGNAGLSVNIFTVGNNISLQQSIGQGSPIGTFYKNGYALRQGFIQPQKYHSATQNSNRLEAIIFPNPACDNMTITITEPIFVPITVTLFDMCGKKLYTDIFPVNQEVKLNYQYLAAGIYILEIGSGNKFLSTKLIKE